MTPDQTNRSGVRLIIRAAPNAPPAMTQPARIALVHVRHCGRASAGIIR